MRLSVAAACVAGVSQGRLNGVRQVAWARSELHCSRSEGVSHQSFGTCSRCWHYTDGHRSPWFFQHARAHSASPVPKRVSGVTAAVVHDISGPTPVVQANHISFENQETPSQETPGRIRASRPGLLREKCLTQAMARAVSTRHAVRTCGEERPSSASRALSAHARRDR